MAIRYSAKEQAATAAAKAIRDYNNAASNLTNRAAALDAVSGKQQSGGLGSILAGIGNSVKNVGDSLYNMFGTGTASVRDLLTGNAGTKKYQNEWKEYAKKNLYGNEDMTDKEYYGKTGGKALDAAATLSDLIPGVGVNPLFNVAQGAASGFGQAKADNPNATGEELRNAALVGGAGGASGALAGKALGKLAQATPKSKIGQKLANAATSQLGRGAIGGATAGATGAGLATALNGGDLASVLANAAQGAQGGALGGATMAGLMGLGGTLYGKAKNRAMGSQNGTGAVEAPVTNELPTNAQKAATSAQNAPEAEVLPRKIAITDYDAGTEQVPVTINRTTKQPTGRGRFIDGYTQGENLPEGLPRTRKGYINDIVRGKNLPEAELPNNEAMLKKLFGMEDYDGDKTLAEAIGRGEMGDDSMTIDYLKGILTPAEMSAVRGNAADYWESTHDDGVFGSYKSKSALPKIDLEDYKDYIGRNGMTRADIDPELLPFLEQGGRKLGSNDWTDIGLKSGEFTQDDVIDAYKRFANTDMRKHYYTNENIGAGLYLDEPLYNRVAEKVIGDSTMAPRQIDVADGMSRSDVIPVRNGAEMPAEAPQAPQGMAEPTYTRRILNEQPQTAIAPRQSANITRPQAEAPQIPHAQRAQLERQYAEARQRQGAELLSQYGTLDAPTRRAVGSPEEVLATLQSEYGLSTPAEVQYAANHVTGKDGAVSKWTRELASQAQNVETAIDKGWLDELIANNGLTDEEAKAVTKQITSALKRTGADGYSDGNTALDTVKQIESQIRQIKGQGGTYHRMTDSDARRAAVLGTVKDELQARIWDAAGDTSKVITPERLAELKSYYEGNQAWANFVDNGIGQVKNGGDLRHLMKPLVDGSKIVEGSKMSAGSFANTLANEVKGANARSLTGAIFKAGKDKLMNSPKAKLNRANKAALEAQNAQAQLNGEAPIKQALASGIKAALADNIGKAANKVTQPLNNQTIANASFAGVYPTFGEVMGNQIARQAANTEGRYANNRREIQSATDDYTNAYNDYATAGQAAQQAQANVDSISDGYQQTSPLDRISQAMDLAMAAGDMKAWGQLADLYSEASKIYTTEEKEPKALSANQSKALVGLQQLDTLSQMAPDAGTALANSPLGFAVNLAGGNDYANQAQSLALTLGYLQSGANITPREAEKIGASYIPSAFDSEEVRQNKLARARQLLQGYLSDTSALE